MADNNYLAEYRRKQQERWAASASAAAATAADDNAQNNTSVNNSNNNNATTAPQLIQEDPLQANHQDATADAACNEDEINEIYATLAKEHAKLKQAQEEYDLEMARKLQEEFDAEYASSLSAEPTSRASSSSAVNNNNQQIQDNNDEEVNVGTADPYVDRLIVDDEVEEQQRNTFNYTRPLPPSATAATSNSQQATTTQIPVQHSYGNSTRRNQQRQQYTIEQPETNYHQEELAQQPHQQQYAQQYVYNQQRSPQANYQQVFEQVTYRTGPNGEPIRIRTVTRNNNGNVQTQEFIEPATRAVHHHQQQQSPQQYLHLNGPTNNTGSTSLSLLNGVNRSLFDPFNQQEEETLPMSMFNRGSSQGFFDSDSSFRYMQRRMAQMRQQAAAMMFNL